MQVLRKNYQIKYPAIVKNSIKLIVNESKKAASKVASSVLRNEIAQNSGLILFPGGSSPISFYKELVRNSMDWKNITIMATDDRVAPLNSVYSNTGMIQKELIDQIEKRCQPTLMDVFPKNEIDINKALIAIQRKLKNNLPKIAFLGMGRDGHTAGIFKENNSEKFCYDFQNFPEPFKRVTISMDIYLKIPTLVFLVFGLEKKKMLSHILSLEQNDQFIPTKFLLENSIGSKTIICDIGAAPTGFSIGETNIKL